MTRKLLLSLAVSLTLPLFTSACVAADKAAAPVVQKAQWPFATNEVATFNAPWAMSFLPDGSLLVSEKAGNLLHLNVQTGARAAISGVPAVANAGQGGFGDVLPHPDFARNQWLYLSYAEAGKGDTRGAAVARARLVLASDGSGTLQDLKVIWRQTPKVEGNGHYGHRLAFGPDGKLWITSSERQKFDPAQDMGSNLGKIVRLNEDGSIPADNPFASQGGVECSSASSDRTTCASMHGVAAQVWSLGHRNALGIAFDARGKLWVHEMGPAGGDELNLIERGANYGYPIVSNGNHYDGREIPDHDTRPEFAAPKVTWTPVISPAGFIIYSGTLFPQWQGSGFIGGLSSKALVRVAFDGDNAREAERFDMGERIREVEQGPDGAIWLLEDGSKGRLLKLTPKA